MKKKKQTGRKLAQGFFVLAFMVIGGICGTFVGQFATWAQLSVGEFLFVLAAAILCLYGAVYLAMAIHEAGHWLFGALTGYRLVSYRLGSFMWMREGKRFRLRRFSLAGTGGQCLMAPPDWSEEGFPCVLYNLGGSLLNLIVAALFVLLARQTGTVSLGRLLLLTLAVTNAGLGLMNGVPLRLMQVDNDGYNALTVKRSRDARWAFWVQMKINELNSRGMRLKDMPEELFVLPAGADMKNGLISAVAVFACSRALDALELERASELNARLLSEESGLQGVLRQLLTCDAILFQLLGENRRSAVDGLLSKEQKKFMKAMKNYPAVLRTEYVLALLGKQDKTEAAKIRARFEKLSGTYPYPAELEGERELMALAEQKAA